MDKFEKRLFNRYHGVILEDDVAYNSEDFKKFGSYMKRQLKQSSESRGFSLAKFTVGHYYVSGFFEQNGKYVYFSYELNRNSAIDFVKKSIINSFLYRTASGLNDYTGGSNNFAVLGDGFMDAVERLLKCA